MIDPHVLFELSQWPVSTSRETQPEGETGYLGSRKQRDFSSQQEQGAGRKWRASERKEERGGKRERENKEKQETRRNKNEEEVTWKKEE